MPTPQGNYKQSMMMHANQLAQDNVLDNDACESLSTGPRPQKVPSGSGWYY